MSGTIQPSRSRAKDVLLGVAIFAATALLWYALATPRAGALPAGAKEPAERAVRQFWQTVLKGDVGKALMLTRAREAPPEHRAGWASYLTMKYERMGLTHIKSVGPARADAYIKTAVRVPYSVAGKKSLDGEAVVRNDAIPGKHEWIICDGF